MTKETFTTQFSTVRSAVRVSYYVVRCRFTCGGVRYSAVKCGVVWCGAVPSEVRCNVTLCSVL